MTVYAQPATLSACDIDLTALSTAVSTVEKVCDQ
jgi:hypothetical protein